MKKVALFVVFLVISNVVFARVKQSDTSHRSFKVFNRILFYDGYAKTVDAPTEEGAIRLSNSIYAKKISLAQLQMVGNELQMDIILNPACDNYDRIGNVSLVFAQKNLPYQAQKNLQKIELARLITPFMDKNKDPKEVVYSYNLKNIAAIFSDQKRLANFDYWLEFEIFGVPYAAQKQVAGCAGKNETFYGTVSFTTKGKALKTKNTLLSLRFKDSLNNYQSTDTLGKTVKTVAFAIDKSLKNASIFLITSNHGANKGGEEYVRRKHLVYVDDKLVLEYKPGGISCEPFRKNNSQRNGIYGKTVKTTEEWTSWNNWCPGAPVPIRAINIGKLKKGKHLLKIAVPDAKFAEKQGHILTSAYLQAI